MPSLWVASSRPYQASVTDSGRNTGRRATREWLRRNDLGQPAGAVPRLHFPFVPCPCSAGLAAAAASPAGVAGGNGHDATTPAAARAAATASIGRSATLRSRGEPASSSPITVPQGERAVDAQQVVSLGPSWDGSTLNASTGQRVPFTLGALILIFVVVQWLIDRRDPKFVEAPARKDDDSIGFE